MKKKNVFLMVLACLSVCIFYACNNQTTQPISKEDSAKIKAWDLLFGLNKKDSSNKAINQVTPSTYASVCAMAYEKLYNIKGNNKPDIQTMESAFTRSLKFGATSLNDRIDDILLNVDCNEIEIVFGVYVDPSTDTTGNNYGLKNQAMIEYCTKYKNRVTAFIWPYKDGKPATLKPNAPPTNNTNGTTAADPENLGQLNPPPF